MPSRDIWKHGSGQILQDLLSSALLTLLLPGAEGRPVYFASPWMSDFALFENASRQVASLFPDHADLDHVSFIQFLGVAAARHHIRIMTSRNATSDAFIERLRPVATRNGTALKVRLSPQEAHEKGILAPGFYIDGSMNITHSGVHVRGEKIAYHSGGGEAVARMHSACFEFDRRWSLLEAAEIQW